MRDNHPFPPCGCEQPTACPPAAPPRGGFLMQQIIGAGRAYLRYERFSLCLEDLPCDARQPLQLTGVQVRECGVRARRCDMPCGRGMTLNVSIPLQCAVRDACGCPFTALSRIEVPVQMRLYDPREADRAQTAANAFARLVRPCDCGCGTLDAWLDVWVEAWLTACRPMYAGACPPAPPPQLPLYPQPCRPR
ncbi:MAG: hypothetical protein IJ157_01435 [Clostridia bacterium]|nr:hypothetical protein [Clostridia bacterium]